MPTRDGFNPDHPEPLCSADQPEQQSIGKAWDRAVVVPRALKASILAAAATAIGIAILSAGNPVRLFADVTAPVAGKSALQPGTDQSAPTIQSTADARALPPTAKDAPTRDESALASEPAGQSQMENSEPSSEALFTQFQAWAAEKDAHAQVEAVRPVQDAPEQVVQNAPVEVAKEAGAPLRSMQKHRHLRPVQSARAEIRPVQNPRKKVGREQNARAEVPPAQGVRAPGQSVQNAQAPSLLQTLGWRN